MCWPHRVDVSVCHFNFNVVFFFPFLWGCKMETVARETCFLHLKDGGLNLVNLKLKGHGLKFAGFASILSDSNDPSFFLCMCFCRSLFVLFETRMGFAAK